MVDEITKIGYEIDQASINKAIQQIERLEKEQVQLANEILASGDASDKQSKELRKLQKEQRDLENVVKVAGSSFRDQAQDIEIATRALDDYDDRLRKVQQGGADLSGDIASGSAGLRGAADVFSGGNSGALGGGLELTEALADIGEFAPRAKVALETLGGTIREGDGIANRAASSFGDVISKVTGLDKNLATVAGVAGVAGIAVGAAALAFQGFTKEASKLDALLASRLDAEEQINLEIARGTLTTQDATERLSELRAEESARITNLETAKDAYTTLIDSTVGGLERFLIDGLSPYIQIFGRLTGMDVEGALSGLENGIEGIVRAPVNALTTLDERVKENTDALQDNQATQEALTTARENGKLADNDARAAQEELTSARETELKQLESQADSALQRQEQLSSQLDSIRERDAIAEANAAELASVQSEIDNENALQKQADFQDKLAGIREAGNAKIAQIDSELSSLPGKRAAELADVQADGNAKIADLQRDYQQSTIESYKEFTSDLKQTNEDAALSIARLTEDITNSLNDATQANDVSAFLKAQRDGEKQLKRANEDASSNAAKLTQKFVEERQKELQAFQQKQAEVRDSIAQEKQAVIQAYNERRAALAEALEAEKEATAQRIEQEQARFREQLERERIRAEQQQRLAEVRERQQQAAEQREIEGIQTKAQAEQQAYQAALQAIQRIRSQASQIGTGGGSFGGANRPMSSFGGNPFARGGSNSTTNNFTQNNTFGDVASMRQVREEVASTTQQTLSVVLGATQRSVTGRPF